MTDEERARQLAHEADLTRRQGQNAKATLLMAEAQVFATLALAGAVEKAATR